MSNVYLQETVFKRERNITTRITLYYYKIKHISAAIIIIVKIRNSLLNLCKK